MSYGSLWTIEPWLPLRKPVHRDGSTSMCPEAHLPERGQEMTEALNIFESFVCQEEASAASRCWCWGAVTALRLSDLSSPMGPFEAQSPQCSLGPPRQPQFSVPAAVASKPKATKFSLCSSHLCCRTCREGSGQLKAVPEGAL